MGTNKFVSFLDAVGKDFMRGLAAVLPWVQGPGETAVGLFEPALGPIFNATVSAVVLAEQKYVALGQTSGSGPKKLADVLQLVEPVVAQGLKDAGRASDTVAVTGYINSVVTVLQAAPAPAPAAVGG